LRVVGNWGYWTVSRYFTTNHWRENFKTCES